MSNKRTRSISETSNGPVAAGSWRFVGVLVCMGLAMALLVYRMVQLHVIDKDFLISQGEARTIRYETLSAHRGKILDRFGEPLAVSTPVETVWVNPGDWLEAAVSRQDAEAFCNLLELDVDAFLKRIAGNADREFMFAKRKVQPALSRKVLQLKIPGVHVRRDYKRFYPAAEVAAQVVGFVDIDERGQEGLELAYEHWLKGVPGRKRVLKDRMGNVIQTLALEQEAKPGNDLNLTIDLRLQYIAYLELKSAVRAHHAKAGTVVVLDARTGEVLAMVNQPSFNPNDRRSLKVDGLRNRAVTDVFEPGSTMKPLTMLAAFETGKYTPGTRIDTTPGILRIGRKRIRDHRNYGVIDVATVIAKSSNVGTTKIALDITGERLWDMFYRLGFGQAIGTGFPGESIGKLPHPVKWKPLTVATLSYGYGLSVTALQLAHAYQVIANDGVGMTPSLLAGQPVEAKRVVSTEVARSVKKMLTGVVAKGGTGTRAQVENYQVAGKTGTVHSIGAQGYADSEYKAIFAGMVPARNPDIVMVVVIDGPQGDEYYGGEVAAPVFSRVAAAAMRLRSVTPDHVPSEEDRARKVETLLKMARDQAAGEAKNG